MLTLAYLCAIMYIVLTLAAIWGVCVLPYLREARRLRRAREALQTRQPKFTYTGRRHLRRVK